MTYFVIIPTKTYSSILSTYLYPCIMKLRRKSHNLSQSSLLLDVKRTFRHTFLSLLAIPELFEQTQGSDYWQLIHSYSMRYHFSLTWSKMLSTMTSRDSYNISYFAIKVISWQTLTRYQHFYTFMISSSASHFNILEPHWMSCWWLAKSFISHRISLLG